MHHAISSGERPHQSQDGSATHTLVYTSGTWNRFEHSSSDCTEISHSAVTLNRSWSIERLGSWCQCCGEPVLLGALSRWKVGGGCRAGYTRTHMHTLGDFATAYHGDVEHFGRLGGGGHGICSSGRI